MKFFRAVLVLVLIGSFARVAGAEPKGDLSAKFTLVAGSPGWHQSMPFLGDVNSFYKDEKLTGMTFKPLPTGTVAGEAIATGAADAGYTNTSTALNLISKGAPVTIISGTSEGGDAVIVYNKAIRSVKGLKGKSVAVPSGSTTHELLFRLHVIPAAGLTYDDIKRVPLAPQDTFLALQRGDVDAAVMFDPYMGTAIGKGATVLVPPSKMWAGHAYSSVLLVRNSLLASNPAIVQALANVHARAIRFIRDHPDQASQQLAGISRQDPSETRASLATVSFITAADERDILVFAKGMKETGLIDNVPDLKRAVNPSFIRNAADRK